MSWYFIQTTREQLDPTKNTAHQNGLQQPKATFKACIKFKTRRFALSQEPRRRPHSNTWRKSLGHNNYRKGGTPKSFSNTWVWVPSDHIPLKTNYKATPRTDWSIVHVVMSIKPRSWKTKWTCPRHAMYSPGYCWHHETRWSISSDNLHKGIIPGTGNRWWQY